MVLLSGVMILQILITGMEIVVGKGVYYSDTTVHFSL